MMTTTKMKRMAIDSQLVVVSSNHCSFEIGHEQQQHSFDCGDDCCNVDRIADDVHDCREVNAMTAMINCCSTSRPSQLSTFSSHHNQSGLCWWP